MPTRRPAPAACRLIACFLALPALPLLACQGCASGTPLNSETAPAETGVAAKEPQVAGALAAVRPLGDSAELRASVDLGSVVVRVPGRLVDEGAFDLAVELAAAVDRMAPRLPVDGPPAARRITVAVEDDYPAMIRHTGEVALAVAGGSADVHLVLDGGCNSFAYEHALARVLVARTEGLAPLPPYLAEGAALWLSEGWYGRRWSDWLPAIAAAGVLPTAGELLAGEEPADGSRPLWTPVAAAVVDALPGATLADKLARLPGAAVVEARLAAIARLAGEARPAAPTGEGEAAGLGRRPLPPFLAGVSLAMLNHVELGYHAPSVGAAMDRLAAAVGADAVSLMPFAFQRDPRAPQMRYLNRSPGSETDLSMIHAARRARERGMTVLWKPQIWLSGGAWPGDVEMTSEEDWVAWFSAYRRYLVHQALLAEWVGADLFSVGVELGRTVGREAEWRRSIAAVRLFYRGPLTYAANWYGDFDRVEFWDELDLLGIDAYEPLSESPAADEAELRAGARRIVAGLAAAAERHGKGIVVTELGYAAHRAAWVAPHEEGGVYSEADQALAYRAMLDALGRPGWLRGVFVWKAFSSEDGAARRGRRGGRPDGGQRADFRFLGRESEAEVARYYGGG